MPSYHFVWHLRKKIFCYRTDRVLSGYGEVVDSGVHAYYFYAKANDGPEFAKLLHYFEHTDANTNGFGALSDAVKLYKSQLVSGNSRIFDQKLYWMIPAASRIYQGRKRPDQLK